MVLAIAGMLGACAAVELDEGPSPAVEAARSPETLIRLGAFAETSGDIAAAAQFYSRASAQNPADPEPLIRLGTLLSAMGAHADAADAYRQLLTLQPGNREVARALGNALIASGQPQEAVDVLARAPQGQSDPRILSSLAVAYDMLGQHVEAQRTYSQALTLSPGDLDIRTNLALSQALAGNDELAIQSLRDVVATPGAVRRHRQMLALALGLAARTGEAADVASRDLNESGVAQALQFYEELRALPTSAARARRIGGAPVGHT